MCSRRSLNRLLLALLCPDGWHFDNQNGELNQRSPEPDPGNAGIFLLWKAYPNKALKTSSTLATVLISIL